MNGILVQVEPVVFRLGPITIRWFGILLVAALAAGLWLTVRRAGRAGFPPRTVLDLASWAVPAGFVGARAFSVLEHWEYYATRPGEVIDPGSGGLSAWGGFIAGGLVVYRLGRGGRLPTARLADAAAPGLLLAEALARLGAFLNGDGQGRPSDLPWATRYSSGDALTPDVGVPRHPAQLYQLAADLAILALPRLLCGAWLPLGARFWLTAGLYGLSRFTIAFVRPEPPFLAGLPLPQLIALAVIGLAAFGIIRSAVRRPAAEPAAPR